jgi:hypothetical protein
VICLKRDFEVAARFLGFIDPVSDMGTKAVLEVLKRLNQTQDRTFRKIEIRDDKVYLQHWDKDAIFPYTSSGSGDKAQLISDFLLEASILLGQYRHVLLILDDFPTKVVSDRFLQRYRQLSSPNIQVIMTTNREGNMLGADVVVELEMPGVGGADNTRIRSLQSIPRPLSMVIGQIIESYKSGMETN